jgi:hypothetical protein
MLAALEDLELAIAAGGTVGGGELLKDPRTTTRARMEGARHLDDDRTRTPFHAEGGKSNRPKAIKLQLPPDPLAR